MSELYADPHLMMLVSLRKTMTQIELAKLLGVKQATVSRWEAGKARPTYNNRLAIERATYVVKFRSVVGPGPWRYWRT